MWRIANDASRDPEKRSEKRAASIAAILVRALLNVSA